MPVKVLVVEDNESVRADLRKILTQASLDIAVLEAQNGIEALKTLTQNAIDLVLCDVQMPVMDGFQFLRMIRARSEHVNTPVIMLTGRDNEEEKVFGLETGASDYVTKPASPAELVARVKVQLKLKSLQDELRGMGERFREMSITDYLTGLFNRRHFMETATNELRRSQRYKHNMALMMFDLDFFKKINDTHGHQVGDQVLVEFAKLLRQTFRTTDVLARYGGEEFIAVFPQANADEAKIAAEKLRARVKETTVASIAAGQWSCSIGIASYPEIEVETVEALIEHADAALYRAKEGGRDRAEIARKQTT